jgi:hypothetical protein
MDVQTVMAVFLRLGNCDEYLKGDGCCGMAY